MYTWIPGDSALRKAARAVSPSRNSENASGNARRPNSSRYRFGRPAVRRRSLRDVARPKSNLHVIRCAGRTGLYAGDRSCTKVGTDLRGLIHLFAPCPWKQSPRSSKGTATRGWRARSIVALVEFTDSSGSSSRNGNCLLQLFVRQY